MISATLWFLLSRSSSDRFFSLRQNESINIFARHIWTGVGILDRKTLRTRTEEFLWIPFGQHRYLMILKRARIGSRPRERISMSRDGRVGGTISTQFHSYFFPTSLVASIVCKNEFHDIRSLPTVLCFPNKSYSLVTRGEVNQQRTFKPTESATANTAQLPNI